MENENKNDAQEFPGYPHYPASEDITNPENDFQKINVRPEDLGPNGRHNSVEQRADPLPDPKTDSDPLDPDADVTPEDREMLSAAYQSRDMEDPDEEEGMLDEVDDDGDPLNEISDDYGHTGADLDVPGSAADDANENIGEEDEENNYYSLGGDKEDNLESDDTGGVGDQGARV